MSLNSREDVNKYYQIINDLVDVYIDKWKIKPSNLKKYLKPGSERFNKFLERNKLNNIKGTDRILKDVIEDRYNMEKDGVIKFESFKIFESNEFKFESLKQCLYKGIEKANLEMEKILADYFDTSLGQIDVVDSDKHMFNLSNWKNDKNEVIIYSKEELEIIKQNMTEYLFSELTKKSVEIINDIKINLSDLIKEDIFEQQISEIFEKDNLFIKIISSITGYKFNGEFGDYKIWTK
jgi:hypothetical protein